MDLDDAELRIAQSVGQVGDDRDNDQRKDAAVDPRSAMNEYLQKGETEHDGGKHQGQRGERVEHAAADRAAGDGPAGDRRKRGNKRRGACAEHKAVGDRAACWRSREWWRTRRSSSIRLFGAAIGAAAIRDAAAKLVGVAGFEPATPSSRTKCATRLRYTPT